VFIHVCKHTHKHTHTHTHCLCVMCLFFIHCEYVIFHIHVSNNNISLFFHFHFHSLKTDPTGKEGVKAKLADLVEIMQPKADVPIQQPAPVGRRF
jgi:hypothetical protein